MATANVNSISIQLQQFQSVASAQRRTPLLHLVSTQENRDKYLNQCVPLSEAARIGDWKEARRILEEDWTLLTAAITKEWETVLHVAVGEKHVDFVKELVSIMNPHDLELQDKKGNTAFHLAAATGNMQIVEVMLKKNECLTTIRSEGVTPLHMAALQGRSEMASYLYPKTVDIFQDGDWTTLFPICIYSGLYDFALKMLEERPRLASVRDGNNETGLHILARKPSVCGCQNQRYRKYFRKFSCIKDNPRIKLTRLLWQIVLRLDNSEMMKTITEPSPVIFNAVEVGNHEFLSEVISTCPDLIWDRDSKGQSIIHISVLNRHACIFNLIHKTRNKDSIVNFVDAEGNNLLHLAAKLAPPHRLNLVSGAALQMMLESSWFESVRKIMPPSYIHMTNAEGLTPGQLFTKEHKELVKKGESWIMRTANSCTVFSALIAAGMGSALFSVAGGNNDNAGTLNYLEKPAFLLRVLSVAVAVISSLTSIVIFLSIHISRCAEDDFSKSLPLKLISGLVTLLISIISMMGAFSSTFFITYCHSLKWVAKLISALLFVPIPLFIILEFPLLSDINCLLHLQLYLLNSTK